MNVQASAVGAHGGVKTQSASAAPVRKVAAAGLAAALTTIVVFILQTHFSISITAELAAAATTIIGFIVAYIVPPTAGETVQVPTA